MEDLIPNKCNYENLLSYKKTKVIFELTYYFCHTYLSKGDRTIDQMIQAARSGKQKHRGRMRSKPHFCKNGNQAD